MIPGRDHVVRAAQRIGGLVRRTPVLRSEPLEEMAGAELYLKAENLQRIGAFKARGAMHAVGNLTGEERARGVITYSSGNHAQAVALAARQLGATCEVTMPTDAPKVKVDVVRSLGARVTFAGRTSTDRRQAALKIQARTGGVIIEPFDHPDTICGQGTATLELVEQTRELGVTLDALVVPVGGGGLIAGACLATDGTDIAIYSVEPVGCDSMNQSLRAGHVVDVEPGPTLADGLKPTRVGEINYTIASPRIRRTFTVTDDEIAAAFRACLLRAKLLIEPSAAAALAVPLRRKLEADGHQRIGILLSGGNIGGDRIASLLQRN